MGTLADTLDALRVEAASPDGLITGTFHLDHGVGIRFLDDSYRRYRERDLERQLSTLAANWWADYLRARGSAVTAAGGRTTDEPWDANSRRFRFERDESAFEGMSQRGCVYVRAVGMRRWRIVIRDGALSVLDELEFADELGGGYAALLADYRRKLMRLRDKHFPR